MKQLLDLGLSKLESDVYLALQELGEAKAGAICKKLNIPNSHIYPTLHKLTEKGLVSFKLANNMKVFKATDPHALQLLFEKKQQEIKQQESELISLIAALRNMPKNKETESDYQYFEGIKAVKAMIHEAYSTAPRQSEMCLVSAVSQSWETLNAFFIDMHKIRQKRNITMRMILQQQTKDLQKHINDRKKIGLIEIRLANFTNHAELLLTQEYLIILDTSTQTKKPCGFMIKNKIFIELFKQIYDVLWSSSSSDLK